jgi:hypothetical protein
MNDKALQNYWYLANKCRMARKDLYRDVLKSVIEEHKWRLKCIDTKFARSGSKPVRAFVRLWLHLTAHVKETCLNNSTADTCR